MMADVKDEFYVEDETPEELQRSLDAAKTVLIIPSGLRRRLRQHSRRLRHTIAADLRRGADRLDVESSSSAADGHDAESASRADPIDVVPPPAEPSERDTGTGEQHR
jgi:hypothetical protein